MDPGWNTCHGCTRRKEGEFCPHDVNEDLLSAEWEKYFDDGKSASDIARDLYTLGFRAGRDLVECGWYTRDTVMP